MSIETAIERLASAIENLAAVYSGQSGRAADPIPAARGRRKATDTPAADVPEPGSSDSSKSPAPASTQGDAAAQPAPATTVDAGTGQKVVTDPDAFRAAVKVKAVKLTQAPDGNSKLRAVLAQFGASKMSEVPDDKLAEYEAAIDQALAGGGEDLTG